LNSMNSLTDTKSQPAKLSISDKIGRKWADLKHRAKGSSKSEAALAFINLAAKTYGIYFTFWVAAGKFIVTNNASIVIEQNSLLYFFLASAYLVIHPFIPKGKNTKWVKEETRRIRMISVAMANIATAINDGKHTETQAQEIIEGTLGAIKSEIETIIVDSDGVNVHVSLLIEHEQEHGLLRVIGRAQKNRRYRNLPKEGAIVWRAMENNHYEYEPDYEEKGREYKSILAFPVALACEQGNNEETVIGGLTIDSSEKYHFNAILDKIEIRLQPYLNMLALALVLRLRARAQ
jgi:hypothetical protein